MKEVSIALMQYLEIEDVLITTCPGAIHIIDECETPNCDHPVHFGGTTTGKWRY